MFLCLINHYPKKTSLNWESLHGFTYWTFSLNMPWISPLPKHTYACFWMSAWPEFHHCLDSCCMPSSSHLCAVGFICQCPFICSVCVWRWDFVASSLFLIKSTEQWKEKKWRGIGMNSISLVWKLLSWNRERASSEERRVLMWSSAKGNEEMEQGCSGEVARKEVCLYEEV